MGNEIQKAEPNPVQRPTPKTYAAPDAQLQAQARNDALVEITKTAIANAGALKLTPEESKALMADFGDEAFQPGAAGKENLIYIEHAALRDRLNQVLGLGQWVVLVRETWSETFASKNGPAVRIYARAMLMVRGCYCGEAVGDMVYYQNNQAQNYGDAFEGSKTAAFRRCAKEFGIGLQAWRKDWCQGWWDRRGVRGMKRGSDIQQPQGRRQYTPPTTAQEFGEQFESLKQTGPIPPQQPAVDDLLDEPGAREYEEALIMVDSIKPVKGKSGAGWMIHGDDAQNYFTQDEAVWKWCETKRAEGQQTKLHFELTQRGNVIIEAR